MTRLSYRPAEVALRTGIAGWLLLGCAHDGGPPECYEPPAVRYESMGGEMVAFREPWRECGRVLGLEERLQEGGGS